MAVTLQSHLYYWGSGRCHFLTPTAERSVAAALRIWFTTRRFLYFILFFSAIFSENSVPMGLKFGHDAWIGPDGDNKDFHRDSFIVF